MKQNRSLVFAVACAAAFACSDGPSEPRLGPPAQVTAVAGDEQTGGVTTALALPLQVRVVDANGRPVPGTPVRWSASSEGGTVAAVADATTDAQGLAQATWTLGRRSGRHEAYGTVGDLAPATFRASAQPAAASMLERVAGNAQSGVVAAPLDSPLVVAVRDPHGNGVAGRNVTWTVTAGSLAITSSSALTDSLGRASAQLTLGTRAGTSIVTANLSGIQPVAFTVSSLAGPAATIDVTPGQAGVGSTGDTLRLRVTAADAYGNPVNESALFWTSRNTAVAEVAADGLARATGPGRTTIVASSAAGVTDSTSLLVEQNFAIVGVHVTQAVQKLDGSVPLVKDRAGMLRVFVTGLNPTQRFPRARIRLYNNGQLVQTVEAERSSSGAPLVLTEDDAASTWNVRLPASLVQPGLSVLAEIDFDGTVQETSESDNVFPREGTPLPLDVRTVPTFGVRFVPVRQNTTGRTGNVTAANAAEYLVATRKLMPLSAVDADVRDVYVTDAPALQSNDGNRGWTMILSEMWALRALEGGSRYYYGVVSAGYSSGVAGYGYIGHPVGMGWDHLPSGSEVAAHEWGHNWERRHAPCGGPANPDGSYPYSGGLSGAPGYDVFDDRLLPSTTSDIMGYCQNKWISDYTYRAVMNFRASEGGAGAATAGIIRQTLLVWGRSGPDGLVLEPAFELAARAALPTRGGSHVLEGFDGAGIRLFRVAFDPVAVAHSDESHFAFALPADLAQPDRLATLRLSGNGRTTERATRATPAPAPAAQRLGAGRVALDWNARDYPMALVRDPVSGRVLSIARRGSVSVHAAGALDVVFSDGVRSVRRRVEIR